MKLNWHNLNKNRCPKCSKDMMKDLDGSTRGIMVFKCGFQISEYKFKSICSALNLQKIEKEALDEIYNQEI